MVGAKSSLQPLCNACFWNELLRTIAPVYTDTTASHTKVSPWHSVELSRLSSETHNVRGKTSNGCFKVKCVMARCFQCHILVAPANIWILPRIRSGCLRCEEKWQQTFSLAPYFPMSICTADQWVSAIGTLGLPTHPFPCDQPFMAWKRDVWGEL